jgi:outer membrane scaffolding protein for murein synthesis (MipA/OmpV family)
MPACPFLPTRSPSSWACRLALCAALGLTGTAWAQDSDSRQAGLPLWEAGVFAGGISTPAYPASSQRNQRALVLPFFVYRGEVLRADRNGLGARMVHTDRFEFDIGFAASLPASSDDIALRQGMPDLGTLIEFGPRAKLTLAQPAPGQRATLEVPLRAVLEFNGGVRQVGYALEPKLAYEWNQVGDWRFKSAASLVIGDQQLNQYFYGVSPGYASANRPAFEAQGGLISSRLTLDGSTRLGPDVNLFAFARYDLHDGAANRSSPLFAQNQGASFGLGLTWTLGRSQSRAASDAR